jgi:DNA invertase Pin-like site-specific DNA recombinase
VEEWQPANSPGHIGLFEEVPNRDPLGRSLQDLVAALHELHAADVDLFLHQQALDTRSPAGRAMFGMLGVFAEFERAMIVARVKSGLARSSPGLARARAQGKRLGRPTVPAAVEARIKALRAKGHGMLAIGRELGIGTSTVQRVLGA